MTKPGKSEAFSTPEFQAAVTDEDLMFGCDPDVNRLYKYQRQVLGYLLYGRSLTVGNSVNNMAIGPRFNLTTFSSNASDLLIYSPTGFGKTLTYIAPIIHFLKTTERSHGDNRFCTDRRPDGVSALILVPTRELANQVSDSFKHSIAPERMVTLGGEMKVDEERRALQNTPGGPDIVVSVAGRIAAHSRPTSQTGDSCRWNCLRYLIIDEADRLLADGYGDWITAVRYMTSEQDILRGAKMSEAPKKTTSLLGNYWHSGRALAASAVDSSSPPPLSDLSSVETPCDSASLSNNSFVRPFHLQKIICTATDVQSFKGIRSLRLYRPLCIRARLEKDSLRQKVLMVSASNAENVLKKCISKILTRAKHQCLLFCASSVEVHQVYKILSGENWRIGILTGTDSVKHRDRTFSAFLSGDTRLLVSSDVSARGLNVKTVTHVVQYGLPVNADEYIHRIGRTARCGRKGKSVLIVRKTEITKFMKMHKTIVELRPTSRIKIKHF